MVSICGIQRYKICIEFIIYMIVNGPKLVHKIEPMTGINNWRPQSIRLSTFAKLHIRMYVHTCLRFRLHSCELNSKQRHDGLSRHYIHVGLKVCLHEQRISHRVASDDTKVFRPKLGSILTVVQNRTTPHDTKFIVRVNRPLGKCSRSFWSYNYKYMYICISKVPEEDPVHGWNMSCKENVQKVLMPFSSPSDDCDDVCFDKKKLPKRIPRWIKILWIPEFIRSQRTSTYVDTWIHVGKSTIPKESIFIDDLEWIGTQQTGTNFNIL
jgi:hypothetical protein